GCGHHPGLRRGAPAGHRRVRGGQREGNLRHGVPAGRAGVRRAARSLILLVSLGATACSTSAATNGSAPTTLTVLAASSLSKVFPEIGSAFTRVNHGVSFSFSFAGTDQLAAQI